MATPDPTIGDVLAAITKMRTDIMTRIDRLQDAVTALARDLQKTEGFLRPFLERKIRACSVPGCGKPRIGNGFCSMHWARDKAGKNLSTPARIPKGDLPAFLHQALGYTGGACLAWPFPVSEKKRYPTIKFGNGPVRVNRLVCGLTQGPAPSAKHHAAHSCGNALCVAPGHLRWATPKENMADKFDHGTALLGPRNHNAKLTEADVRMIRAQRNRTQTELAAEYGVSQLTISHVLKGKTWGWVTNVEKRLDDLDKKWG
jgi:hypothetical protein